MTKCPHCGSTNYPHLDETIYDEDGDILNVIRRYTCSNCGERFVGYTNYVWDNMEEEFEKETNTMKTSNYLYIAHSQMYGMLHGMHDGGCLDNLTLEDAQDIARYAAYDVVTGYDCIMEAIHDDLNELFGYDDTPDNPNAAYLDALEESIEEECEYSLYEITPEGEEHRDKMEADYESVDEYLKNGWLKNC